MSGRSDQDGLPPAATRYADEEAELVSWLDRAASEEADTDMAIRWLDATIYRHREEAYAQGLLTGKHWKPGWWDRNWFALAFLGLLAAALLMIGLINGWS